MFSIRLSNDHLSFSAAHFITFDNGVCETLHGHDYRVTAELQGTLDENQYVADFLAVQEVLKAIVRQLDHGVLLPTGHVEIQVVEEQREVQVTFADRRWVFPRTDCRLLDIPNTTSERLAQWIALRLQEGLQSRLKFQPQRLRVELSEGSGFTAVCELHPTK